MQLLSDSTLQAGCVYLTTDAHGLPVISWNEWDIQSDTQAFYMSYFDVRSGQFPQRIPIPVEQGLKLHEEGMPKIAIRNDGSVIALYELSTATANNRFAGVVRYRVSGDSGRTWSVPAFLHTDTITAQSRSYAAICRLSDGEIAASWLGEKLEGHPGRPVYFARTERGRLFGEESIIDSSACECCRIAMACDPTMGLTIAYRDLLEGSVRDISAVRSVDHGRTFTAPKPFSGDGWVIDGCPHNGPALCARQERIYATWYNGGVAKGVYYAELNPDLETLRREKISEEGRFIQLTLLPDGARMLAFDERYRTEGPGARSYSRIVIQKTGEGEEKRFAIEPRASTASFPVIQAYAPNHLVVAWSQDGKVYYEAMEADSFDTD